ncbi:MAG: sugar phosphate isomerase/epimerase [Ignisphaera sp.]|nr:sugar phosphate isomerase/epimerase [Ignisphaera sp.]MCX8168384.1 sugar phosphate isomerase/epimerase [Ignisphaera sp.]MDW8085784.1 sugar phosphate isomerase/epimerase [Ignisphaera sp.]
MVLRIALQLYSLRHELQESFERVLEDVSSIGFEGVEFAGLYGRDPTGLRELLYKIGLEVAGAHTPVNTLIGPELEKTVRLHIALGNRYLIIPGLPEELRKTRNDWIKFSEILDSISGRLVRHGMRVGYHNHRIEFTAIEGEKPWDIVFSRTSRDVIMQLDVGHALAAQINDNEIIEIIRKYRGRAVTVHVKEYSKRKAVELKSVEKGYEVVIGEGETRWADILKALRDYGGTEWIIIEQEVYPYKPPIESIKRSFVFISELLKTL